MSRAGWVVAWLAFSVAVAWQPGEAQMHHPAEVDCMAFSSDGKYLITVTRAAVLGEESVPTEVRLWDVDVGVVATESKGFQEKYQKETGHRSFYLTIATCQIEPPIIGILHGTKVNLYDWRQQRLAGTKRLEKPTWARGGARLHRSGAIPGAKAAFVEVGYEAGPQSAQIFAVPSGKPLPELERRVKGLLALPVLDNLRTADANVALAARGRGRARVAFVNYKDAGEEKTATGHAEEALVWDETQRRIVATVPADLTAPVALSRDGALVATVRGNRDVRIFDVASGRDYLTEKRALLAEKAEALGVFVRYGYREGALGERFVPEVTDSLYAESNLILYLDGRPVSVERLTSELEAEIDETPESYIAFFGAENRSAKDVVIDLLIEVPISVSDWETVMAAWEVKTDYGFWYYRDYYGRFDYDFFNEVELGRKWQLKVRQSRLLLRRQFGARAGGAVKDQISLGRREPVDLSISTLSVTPVPAGWLANLERTLLATADSLESATAIRDQARALLKDRRALGYRQSLQARLEATEGVVAGHRQKQWRDLLKIGVETPGNYDPDFFNDVKVRVLSTAPTALSVLVGCTNGKPFTVSVPAGGAQNHVVQIQRVPRDELVCKVLEATVEKR